MPATIVDSSWIDIEAGLAKLGICKVPPDFCATAGNASRKAAAKPAAIGKNARRSRLIRAPSVPAMCGRYPSVFRDPCLFVQPDVFHAPAVIDAVDHDRQALHMRLPAARADRIEQHRAHRRLGQLALDLPNDLLALFGIGFARLAVDQLVKLGIAVSRIIARRTGRSEEHTSDSTHSQKSYAV